MEGREWSGIETGCDSTDWEEWIVVVVVGVGVEEKGEWRSSRVLVPLLVEVEVEAEEGAQVEEE